VTILPEHLYFLDLLIPIDRFLLRCSVFVLVLLDMCCNESSAFRHTTIVCIIPLVHIPVTLRGSDSRLGTVSPIGAYMSVTVSSMGALMLLNFMYLNPR